MHGQVTVPSQATSVAGMFMMTSNSTSAIYDGHRTQLTLTPASGTVTGLLFPLSLQPVGEHFSTDSGARKRNREQTPFTWASRSRQRVVREDDPEVSRDGHHCRFLTG